MHLPVVAVGDASKRVRALSPGAELWQIYIPFDGRRRLFVVDRFRHVSSRILHGYEADSGACVLESVSSRYESKGMPPVIRGHTVADLRMARSHVVA